MSIEEFDQGLTIFFCFAGLGKEKSESLAGENTKSPLGWGAYIF